VRLKVCCGTVSFPQLLKEGILSFPMVWLHVKVFLWVLTASLGTPITSPVIPLVEERFLPPPPPGSSYIEFTWVDLCMLRLPSFSTGGGTRFSCILQGYARLPMLEGSTCAPKNLGVNFSLSWNRLHSPFHLTSSCLTFVPRWHTYAPRRKLLVMNRTLLVPCNF